MTRKVNIDGQERLVNDDFTPIEPFTRQGFVTVRKPDGGLRLVSEADVRLAEMFRERDARYAEERAERERDQEHHRQETLRNPTLEMQFMRLVRMYGAELRGERVSAEDLAWLESILSKYERTGV